MTEARTAAATLTDFNWPRQLKVIFLTHAVFAWETTA
jgi:hypothetical protein